MAYGTRRRDDRLWTDILEKRYNYTLNQPPYIPAFPRRSNDELQDAWPAVAVAVANILTENAGSSPVWTFAFNIMAADGWRNNDFATLVQLTYDVLVSQWLTGEIRDPRDSDIIKLTEATANATASAMALTEDALMDELSDSHFEAVKENAEYLRRFVRVAEETHDHVPRGRDRDRGRGSYSRETRIERGRSRSRDRDDRDGRRPYRREREEIHHAASMAPVGGTRRDAAAATDRSRDRDERDNRSPRESHPAARGRPVDQGNTINGEPKRADAPPPKATTKTSPALEGELDVSDPKNIRELHRIPYISFFYQNEDKRIKETQDAMPAALDAIDTDPKDIETYEGNSLSQVLNLIMAEHRDTKGLNFHPYAVTIDHELITPADLTPIFKKADQIFKFSELAKTLRTAIATVVPNTPENRKAQLTWVTQFDRVMTDLVNNWLKHSFPISVGQAEIDSFMMDAGDMEQGISTVFGPEANVAYRAFESKVMRAIQGNWRDWLTAAETATEEVPAPTPTVPVKYAVTYISENACTLNYGFPKDKSLVTVAPDQTPLLYNALIRLQRLSRTYTAVRNIILLADGTKFEFYASSIGIDQFFLREL